MLNHSNRVVLVTGAGSGIGLSIAEAFAQNGASVGILDFNKENVSSTVESLRSRGYWVHGCQADVSDYDVVRDACAEIEDVMGPIDTIINNAGISPKHNGVRADAWDMDVDEWRRVVDVNLSGCFNTVRAVAPGMVKRGFGSIINMSSVAGRAYLPLVGVHYSTTKAALIGFTRHLAGELGPYGITVNAIAPGRIDTPLMRNVPDEVNQKALEQTPLGRFGLPEDVANLALFLTSAQGAFITGQVVDVAGGWLMT
jgi:3-oxoacyl-[acyl-carrier protein] reductase